MEEKTSNFWNWVLVVGIVIGALYMIFKKEDEMNYPVETIIDTQSGEITASFIIENLNDYVLYDSRAMGVTEKEEVSDEVKIRALKGLLQMITEQVARENPEDIRGCITEKLENLMKNHNTGKITLDL